MGPLEYQQREKKSDADAAGHDAEEGAIQQFWRAFLQSMGIDEAAVTAGDSAQITATPTRIYDSTTGTTTNSIQWLVVPSDPGIVMEHLVVRNTDDESSGNALDVYVAVALDSVEADPSTSGSDPTVADAPYLSTLEVDPTLSGATDPAAVAADDEFPHEFDRDVGAVAIGVVSSVADAHTTYEIEFRGAV